MDWSGLLVGAVLGAVAGLVLQNLMFPRLEERVRRHRERAFYAAVNVAWERVEACHPRLMLVQAGWDKDGSFPDGSVILRLGKSFRLRPRLTRAARAPHEDEWTQQGFVDQDQIGIAAISIRRTSDAPVDQLEARSHHMQLTAHRYRYFDYLATHVLRFNGSPQERELLNEIVGDAERHTPVMGFPNPCSVAISLFCESGAQLILPHRSRSTASGGWWAGGRIYNAVGEGAAPRDLYVGLDGSQETTPHRVARRGLHEEVGLSDDEVHACILQIHSLAWATDLLDHKFFGLAISPLSYAEIQDRWRTAPDRAETDGVRFTARRTRTREECLALVRTIKESSDDWAPEAVFSTLRSLVCLRRLQPGDVVDIFR